MNSLEGVLRPRSALTLVAPACTPANKSAPSIGTQSPGGRGAPDLPWRGSSHPGQTEQECLE